MLIKIPETAFVNWLEEKGLCERTIKEYTYYLNKLNALGKFNQENTDKLIRKFNNNVCRAFLRNVIIWLTRNKVETKLTDSEIVIIGAIDIPKKVRGGSREIPETISHEEIKILYKAFKKDMYRVMLVLTYRCALRISELFSISKNDFNFETWKKNREENGILRIGGKGAREVKVHGKIKKKKKDTILVKPFVMELVDEFIRKSFDKKQFDPKLPIFQAIKPHVWRHALKAAGKKSLGKHINPHLLRHSYATYLFEQGWDIRRIQVFLRHKDISSTQIYAQVSKKQLSEDYAKIK